MTGRLVLCATPIGNLEDTSLRALRTLREADVVACEDTRRTRKLLSHHGIRVKELIVYNDANERRQAKVLLERVARGDSVVLVSDAGTPGLSDPGYRLVRACIDAGLRVEAIPGPNAAVTALVLSGLAPGRFVFEGFLPRKGGDRRKRIAELASEPRTIVLYESPHRVANSLADLADVLGDRPAVVARELTKMYEELIRGTLPELRDKMQEVPPRGEIVIVVGGAVHDHAPAASAEELRDRARDLMAEGVARKEALTQVAQEFGVPRRKVFDALLEG